MLRIFLIPILKCIYLNAILIRHNTIIQIPMVIFNTNHYDYIIMSSPSSVMSRIRHVMSCTIVLT